MAAMIRRLSLSDGARPSLAKMLATCFSTTPGEMNSDSAGPSRGEKPGDSRVFAKPFVGGHEKALRQTLIALAKDAALAEHASSGEATLIVLRGRVTLTAGTESWEGREGRPAHPP